MSRYADDTVETAVRTLESSPAQELAQPPPSGARSGAVMAVASFVGIVLNYAFLLAAGRFLGIEDYGALAALLGLLTVILLPTGAVQMAVSRDVARHLGSGDAGAAEAFSRAVIRLSLLVALPIVGVGLVLAWPVGKLLSIDTGLVALSAGALATAFVLPAAQGVLQGYQRFRALAAMYVFPFLLRLALLGAAVAAGMRLGGAVLATVVAVLVTAALVVLLVREPLRRGAERARPSLAPFVRYLVPVSVGLIGVAVLTNVDVLVVRSRFSPEDAGIYAAASAFARVAFFLPATILAVVFPRTAARQARGEQTDDILGRALLVAAAFSGLLAVGYVLTGEGLVVSTFGADFADAGALLPAFALAMGLYSIANVLAGYHLSRGETRYAWIVAAAVPVQVLLLAVVPGTLEGVIWTNVAVGVVLIAAHELAIGSSLPALRAGASHLVPEPLALRLRGVAREGGIALAVYTGLALFVTWPLARGLGSTFIGDERNDAAGTIGWLWRLGEEGGYHVFGSSTHELTGAPFGWEEGNALNFQWLVPYYPASLLEGATGEVFAYNAVILSGLALSALAMYALARYLGCRPLVAGWAGVAFMLLPWVMWRVNAGHASLVHVWVLPLLLLSLAAWTARPTATRVALVGGAVLTAWLTSGYFGAMAGIGAFAYLLVVTVVRTRTAVVPRALRDGVVAAGAVVLGTLIVGIATIPGRLEGVAVPPREVSSLDVYGTRPLELLVPAREHPILGPAFEWLRPGIHLSNVAETTLFLGWLTLALGVTWLVALALRRRLGAVGVVSAGLAGVVFAGFAFALASPVEIAGLTIRTPSWLLFQVLPQARVPSRFVILVAAALVPLAALGLQALVDRVRGPVEDRASLRRVQLVVLLAVGFTLFEFLPSLGKPLDADVVPAPYRALASTPEGVLVEYPLGPPGTNAALEYALRQRIHGRPLLNGARVGSLPDEARLSLVEPGAAGTPEALALLGVTAIVTRGNGLGYVKGIPVGKTPELGSGYELVGRFPDEYAVWRVTAPPAPALATLTSASVGDPSPPRRGFVGLPLEGGQAHIELRAPRAGSGLLVFELDAPEERRLRVSGLAGEQEVVVSGRATVSVPVSYARGVSRVLLRLEPEAPGAKSTLISPPRVVATDRDPVVRAEPRSADPGF